MGSLCRRLQFFKWLCVLLFGVIVSGESNDGKEWVRRYIRSTDDSSGEREARAPERIMYLNQGVEFVFPLGVHYTLANVNEQPSYPVPTTGFESVLEFPRNKMAIMFSSMVNTLRLANFSVYSTIYTNDTKVLSSPAMRILGTDVKPTELLHAPATTIAINRDISTQTDGIINDFIPKAAYFGSAIYPFTKAIFSNTIKYENYWAWPWRDGGFDKFSDSPLVPYMEVEGLMPYYENEAFAAIAALFKGGTGSVVFLKPKGNVTILQLMLQPTALTEIFDENFPGWGVKTMRVKVPAATFTTTTRHAETLQKRGVVDTFCSAEVRENLFGVLRVASSHFLNPIVQTNHVQISKDLFRIASATGATLNSQSDYDTIPRIDPIYADVAESSEADSNNAGSVEATTVADEVASGTAVEEEVASTGRSARSVEFIADSDEPIGSTEETVTTPPESQSDTESTASSESEDDESSLSDDPRKSSESQEPVLKGGKRGNVQIESYVFDEPFLWFLHATNEEPMFMGIIESFKRYKEQGSSKLISLASHKFAKDGTINVGHGSLAPPLVDVIADTANINLWNC
ncbi:Antithrombin-III [Orchesella cincta]|uniref:Antithrombin-III n=1 Tax=Orchesella cincta TaxID=48709 RepID=A0A1D2NBD2_ORCCI|nr:Antithrombin-III [Orchesella cincta]